MRLFFTTFFVSITCLLSAQLNVKDINPSQIPANLKYKGKVVAAVSYTDSLGLNYIIQTETGLLNTKSSIEASKNVELISVGGKTDTIRNVAADYRIKGLFVYHYVISKDSAVLLWKNLDNMKDCSYKYLKADYLTKPIITDLDQNNKAEVWLMYETGCRENDSINLNMKLVLYSGVKSYTVRGIRLTKKQTITDFTPNMVKADTSFSELPQAFVDYSKNLWNKFIKEP